MSAAVVSAPSPPTAPPPAAPDAAGDLRTHAAWFIQLRWLAILACAGAIAIGGPVLGWIAPADLPPLAACVAALILANLAYRALARRGARPPHLLLLQVYVDLALLTALLHFSGGLANPLYGIYLLHVVIAGILLEERTSRWVTVTCCAGFSLLAALECAGTLPRHALGIPGDRLARDPAAVGAALFAFNVLLLSTAALTSYIVRRMRGSEARLRASVAAERFERQRLDSVVNAAGAGMRLLSQDLTILWCNRSIETWFGDRVGIGRCCPSTFGKTVMGCPTCLCRAALDQGNTVHGERAVPTPEGRPRIFDVTASPILDEAGRVVQVVELIRDVTQERERAAQLARAGKMAAIGELAGRIAHEINNPAGILTMKVRLLLDDAAAGGVPEKFTAGLGMIERHVQRISTITRGLLSYARPSIERKWRQDLNGVVRAGVELLGDANLSRQVRLEVTLAPEPLEVTANGNELQQVLLNLVNNACDAMPAGGRLCVTTSATPADVVLAVSDTGSGIRPEDLPRVFEPFFTTKPEGVGTGLGLSISQGIVRDHGGTLEVESVLGKGSSFTVRLPRARAGSAA
ncbi:MAG: PAS domain-containing protein [Planctomycetes bacterium]|nr:PAS domain-containing protein [Planctomycetota bacterium]